LTRARRAARLAAPGLFDEDLMTPTLTPRLAASAIAAAFLILAACGERAQEAPPASAAPAPLQTEQTVQESTRGFDAAGLAALDRTLAELAASQDRSGFVAVLARDGAVRHVSEAGYADIEAGRPMTADTVVRVASMTKPVTAAAVMMLIEDGAISLSDPVADYIPAFAGARAATRYQHDENYEIPTEPLARPITIEDLLTHTSGIGYIFDYQTHLGALYIGNNIYEGDAPMDARMETLAGLPLYFQPGETWYYSFSNDVLGHVISVAAGQSLEAFFQARIFGPLGMTSTTFFPQGELLERLAALYTHDETGALARVPPEDDIPVPAPMEAGGASLFSTANDYMRFALMLANGGELDGVRVLTENSVAAMTAPHVGLDRMPAHMAGANLGFGYSLGVTVDGPGDPLGSNPGDFGWGGYFDTDFLVSPATGVTALIIAQENPGPGTADTIGAREIFRQQLLLAMPRES